MPQRNAAPVIRPAMPVEIQTIVVVKIVPFRLFPAVIPALVAAVLASLFAAVVTVRVSRTTFLAVACDLAIF
jgi:hypothetical protein